MLLNFLMIVVFLRTRLQGQFCYGGASGWPLQPQQFLHSTYLNTNQRLKSIPYGVSFVFLPKSSPNSTSIKSGTSTFAAHIAHTDANIWHTKLGNPSPSKLRLVAKSMNFKVHPQKIDFCNSCKYGKLHQLPFANHAINTRKLLEIIYSDIWGPSPYISSAGHRYYVVFIDAYSRFTWFYPLKLKSDVFSAFITFKTHIELQLDLKIKALHTDRGGISIFSTIFVLTWHCFQIYLSSYPSAKWCFREEISAYH